MYQIDDATLIQVACDVCGTMLGISLSPPACSTPDGPRWVASVQISGEADVLVELETDRTVAMRFACCMFSMDPLEIEETDLRDALGEVVNMIGGNVKGVLSGECNLSLPSVEVLEVRDVGVIAKETEDLTVRLSCEGSPFILRVTGAPCAELV